MFFYVITVDIYVLVMDMTYDYVSVFLIHLLMW